MSKYHKIQTVWNRDPDNKYKTLIENEWAKPEFAYLQNYSWICTEKIHGMNMRVIWDGEAVRVAGRTDRAQIPGDLMEHITEKYTPELFVNAFPDCDNVVLYGEGYGAGIQKGTGAYSKEKKLVLFDIATWGRFLPWDEFEALATEQLSAPIVPVIARSDLNTAIQLTRKGFDSLLAEEENYQAEGLVCRFPIELYNRYGERVITKIKTKDFS